MKSSHIQGMVIIDNLIAIAINVLLELEVDKCRWN